MSELIEKLHKEKDWSRWHEAYQVSPDLQARLLLVQAQITKTLDSAAAGTFRVISLCAGDGRDLIGVLAKHERAKDVEGWLVETNAESVTRGRAAIADAALAERLTYLVADATLTSTYIGSAPADLIVIGGVFGNLRHDEVPRLIQDLPALCKPGALVVWTRHRHINDGSGQIATIRRLFRSAGFEAVAFDTTSEAGFSVGAHRYFGAPKALVEGEKWFEFGGVELEAISPEE